jgi:putative transposase
VIPRRTDPAPATGPAVDDDTLDWIRAHLAADAVLLRRLTKLFADQLLAADADRWCRADPEAGGERVNRRNGYRTLPFDTPAGTVALAVPRLRHGRYTAQWLFDGPELAAEAIEDAACGAYVGGMTASAISDLTSAIGMGPLSSSRTAAMAAGLDAAVAVERDRPLGPGPYPELWLVAYTPTSGRRGRTTTVRLAIAGRPDGGREVLGLAVTTADDETGWQCLLRGLVKRGLDGVAVAKSDEYTAGLVRAVRAELASAVIDPPSTVEPRTSAPRSPPTVVIRDHGRLRQPASPPADRRRSRVRRGAVILAAVAVVVVAVVLAIMWRTGAGPTAPTGPTPPLTSSTAPSSTAVTPAPTSVPAPAAQPVAAPSSTIVTCQGPATNVRSPWLQQVLCATTAGS